MVTSVWRIPALAVLGVLGVCVLINTAGACPQDAPAVTPQSADNPSKQPTELPLDIYDFPTITRTEESGLNEGLPQAIGDALLLQFLGQSRIQVQRVRKDFQLPASAEIRPMQPSQQQQKISEGQVRFILDGRIGVIEPPRSNLPGAQRSAPHFLIVKYWLREVGGGHEPKILLDAEETATLERLPATVTQIAERVLAKLIPPTKIIVQIQPIELSGVPEERRAFYLENTSELLQAELEREGWIEVAGAATSADYSLQEELALHEGNYNLKARVFRRDREQAIKTVPESGSERDVLAGQLRVARQIVEELRTRTALLSSTGGLGADEPDASSYLSAAQEYQKTDPDLAIPLYRHALALDPYNLSAKLSLAQALLERERAADVLKILKGPDIDRSMMGQLLLSVAHAFLSQKNEALEAANRAVLLGPGVAGTYWWRGQVRAFDNDFKGALPDYQRAVKLDPTYADFYVALAHAEQELGNYSDAVLVLGQGRERAKNGGQLAGLQNGMRRRAALTLLEAAEPNQALLYAQAAAEDEPGSEVSLRILGMTYHALSRLPEAESALAKALAAKETPESLSEMAAIRLSQGQTANARTLALTSISKDPDGSQAYQVLIDSVSTAVEAKEIVERLKAIWREHPKSFEALGAWGYLQLAYLPNDPAELRPLYLAFTATLQGVPYQNWMSGWANMVELALVSGEPKQAARIATELLALKPPIEYSLNLRFYLWLAELVQGDCNAAQVAWTAFSDLLSQSGVDGWYNPWNFAGTRQFVLQATRAGTIEESRRAQVHLTLDLLERHPLHRADIDRFKAATSSASSQHCP